MRLPSFKLLSSAALGFHLLIAAPFCLIAQDTILPSSPSTQPAFTPEFDWNAALRQSLSFMTIQQGFRVATQVKTRQALRGAYFRDWLASVSNLRGWHDGDSVLANYVGHPMEGAIAGYIYVQNHRRFNKARFGEDDYWRSRFRALAWSTVYSTNYELGPLGDAAIGNVGAKPGSKGAVDLVVTPTLGLAWMVTEDALDRHLILRIESKWRNPAARLLVRSWLNPSRSMANVLRGKWPWYRDDRGGVREP